MEDHAVAILLEGLQSQFRVFGEALQGQREALQRLDDKATAGFNAQDVRLQRLETGVSVLRTDMSDVKERLGQVETRLESVDTRLGRVEHHLELNGAAISKAPTKRKPRR